MRLQPLAVCFVVLVWLASTIASASAGIEPGRDYQLIIPQQAVTSGGKIEVIEMMDYDCPYSFRLEALINPWIRRLPADVAFRRMPAVSREAWLPLAKLFYALEKLGVLKKLHPKIFSTIHADGVDLKNATMLMDWVDLEGLDRRQFENAYQSAEVADKAHAAQKLARKYGVEMVPAMVIDGKYLTSGEMTPDHRRMLRTVDYLIQKARRERSAR